MNRTTFDKSTNQDQWPDGSPISRTVIYQNGKPGSPSMVGFNMPKTDENGGNFGGQRVLVTIEDYNKNFPELWNRCNDRWRNQRNRNVRERLNA